MGLTFRRPPFASLQVGFWMNCFVAIKECKPHFFKHNCKECHRTGLMRCPKCDGFGVMERVGVDNRREMTISRRMKESMDDGGMFDCTYCNKKGVKRCEACQGQGWHLSPYLNYRKFQPHPIFEEYHQSRDRMMARDPKYMKALEKANRKQEEERKLKMEEEEYERKREARRKAKELKMVAPVMKYMTRVPRLLSPATYPSVEALVLAPGRSPTTRQAPR